MVEITTLVDVEQAGTPNDGDEGAAADATNGKAAHSNDEEEEVDENSSSPASRGDITRDPPFPQQLMHAIDHETVDGFMGDGGERVLEWGEDGTSFVVRHKAIFESHVLPKHFNVKCKYMSFVRKLYRWGFRQVEIGVPGTMKFMHVNFVRGDMQRCLMLRSLVKKATAHRNQQQMVYQQQQLLLHHANNSNNNLMNQLRIGMMPPGMGIGHFGLGFGAPFGMAGAAGMMFQQHPMLSQAQVQMMQYQNGQIQQYQTAQLQFQQLMNQGQGLGDPISPDMMGMTTMEIIRARMRLEQQQHQQQEQQQQQQLHQFQNTVSIGSKDIPANNDDTQPSNDKIDL